LFFPTFELISCLILVSFSPLAQDINIGPKNKPSILGTASLNLADYTSAAEEVIEIILPLSVPVGEPESAPSLHVSLQCEQEVLVNKFSFELL